MKSIELFAGAGGLSLGTHKAGFRSVALLEWNQRACDTLRRNVSARSIGGIRRWDVQQSDIKQVDFHDLQVEDGIDLLSGGVPCQPFSVGGKGLAENDPREMFPDFVRAVRTLQPKAFIVENVRGLLRPAFRSYFNYVLLQLTHPTLPRLKNEAVEQHLARLEQAHTRGQGDYNVVFRLLNAADYGVPQARERVFLVGFRSELGLSWSFPTPTHSKQALLADQASGAYWERHGVKPPKGSLGGEQHSLVEESLKLAPWRTVRDALDGLPTPTNREHPDVANHILPSSEARIYPGHTGSSLDRPAKTLKAGVHGVPGGENMLVFPNGRARHFTVREAARLQTFPDAWKFEGPWSEGLRQLGNAVPVDLAAVVASSVAVPLQAAKSKLGFFNRKKAS
jgi:DNA (cytosine-5)-methyltransferase 1